jgi:hypothetical protein
MGISPESSSIATLREQAALQGVSPTDEDLEAVGSFLEVILPPLRDLEERIPPEIAP